MRRFLASVSALALPLSLAGCAKHYKADGMVLRIDAAKQRVVISHRDIRGYMPAMTMPFAVKHARELEQVGPGARVRFELSVNHERTVITSLRKTAAASPGFQLPATHPLPRGERVPDFALISEQGRPVRLSDFRGKVVALDFIYTRCPLPDVCPRLSANFRRLQRRFGPSLTLLSVTIDPVHDTPERLSQYAKLWTANPDSWHFLTGDPREIQKVASNFGMIYFPDDESITHTSNTAVIARDGTLAGIVEGSSYAVSQLGDLIALELEAH